MSNKASNNLHQLICSLSKPEKRYFKIYSSKHMINQVSNYQKLFDAIASQDEYDEEQILRKFKNEGFIRRFSITKNRLYNAVLRSLDAFHSNSSVEAQLKRQIHHIEILYRKSLYGQAAKLLKGAQKVAKKNELFTSLLELSKWEKRLMEQLSYEGVTEAELEKHHQDDLLYLSRLTEFNKIWNLKSRVFNQLYKKGRSRSDTDTAQFEKAVNGLVSSKTPEGSIENTYLYLHTLSAYYFGINDYAQCYTYLSANVEHLSKHPDQFKDEPNIFLSVLSNAIFVGNQIGEFDRSRDLLRKVKSLPAELGDRLTRDMAGRIFATAGSLELSLHIHSGKFEQGLALIPKIEEELLEYESKMGAVKKAQFYFNISIICFGAGHYNEALKWINQLLNNVGIDQSLDIHCFAQMFNLVIHLELGNKSLLGYALRSTQRYLETRNRVYQFEPVFLEFINDSLKKRNNDPNIERYEELSQVLEGLRNDPYESTVFEYFDFLAWAKSKAQGISYAESLKLMVQPS